MLLFPRPKQTRKRQILFSAVAACCLNGFDASLLDASDEAASIATNSATASEQTELTLRPARPFDASDIEGTKSPKAETAALPFRKPVIAASTKPAKTETTRGVKVPAKTVSNRAPAATPSARPVPVTRGWVARNAVNLDQPLRDPGHQALPIMAATQPADQTVPDYAKPASTTTVKPAQNGERQGANRPDTDHLDTHRPDTHRQAVAPPTSAPTAVQRPSTAQAAVAEPKTTNDSVAQRPKVRPTLVLPKHRQPMKSPAAAPKSSAAPEISADETASAAAGETSAPKPRASQLPTTVSAKADGKKQADVKTQADRKTLDANGLDGGVSEKEMPAKKSEASTAESRAERIIDRLLPLEGTATGSIMIPKKSPVKISTETADPPHDLNLQPPAKVDSASQPQETAGNRIASSKPEKVVIRKLRIGTDGSESDMRSGKTTLQREVIERDIDGTAKSYSGDLAPAPQSSRNQLDAQPTSELGTAQSVPPIELDYAGQPKTQREVSHPIRRLQPGMAHVLNYFYQRPEIADGRSNWGMLHSIMVYGIDTRVRVGRRDYSAIAWIAGNNICRGQRLAESTPNGIRIKSGVGLQGHQAQMLAVFSLCGVPLEYPIYADGQQYSLHDVMRAEMRACKSGEELTFTLIALSHYLDSDETWTADDGETWSVERLIREELSQPIVGAACGGTHRLMGFTHALRNRRMEGKPITGQWARAEAFTNDFIQYAYQLQNRDGSMSTNWFEGREDNGNVDRKIQTTGHIVEWLLTVTPDSQLEDPRLVRAVRYLLSAMYNDLDHDWSIGPKGHALRSLAMYHQRLFGTNAWQSAAVANRGRNSSAR